MGESAGIRACPINTRRANATWESRKTSRAARRRKDVWSTLLQIGLWFPTSESCLYHRPCGADHHSHRDIANVVKYSKNVTEDGEFCDGKDVCIGPIIKHCVFDAFFGILCSILLFIGARMRHRCFLIFWILITLGCSIKYLYVFFVSDWTSLEDWVAISYLAFYTAVTLVVVAFTKECGTTEGGVVHDYGAPAAYKA